MNSTSSSGDAVGTMPMAVMQMVFFTSTSTPLYSMAWAPMGTGAYAGTCIFLIILASVFRALFVVKSLLENRWADKELHRRPIIVRGRSPDTERLGNSFESKTGTLIVEKGVEEQVKVVRRHERRVTPWRISVDLPRAALTTVIAGVGYLL